MTREEEIQKEAKIFYASSDDYTAYKKGFEVGAEWADQNPRKGLWDAEKVIKWIENNYENYESTYADIGGYIYSDFQIDKFIDDLRKAMED